MENSPDIFDRLKRSRNLPALPQVLLKLIEACNDDGCTPQRLSEITFRDPAISARVLQLVNSAYSGLGGKITTLEKAIVYLGANTVKNIAISASVLHVFGSIRGNGIFNLPGFWWHSLLSAALCKAIAVETGYPAPEEAFLSGLLHDIGKLALWANFREEYAGVLKEAEADSSHLLAGETQLGTPHQEVGAWLVRQWNLNSFMADAIFYHHSSLDQVAEALPLVKIVYAANRMSRNREEMPPADIREAGNLLGLEPEKLEALIWQAGNEIKELALFFDIAVDPAVRDTPAAAAVEKTAGKALATEVKNVSLVYGTLQGLLEATSLEDILKTASQGFAILFHVPHPLFFLYDERRKTLIGRAVPGNNNSLRIDQLPIPLNGSKSVFAGVFRGSISADTIFPVAHRPLLIGETQILRLLGTDRMVCLPIRAFGAALGVLVAGLDEQQAATFFHEKRVLDLFLGHMGVCLRTQTMMHQQAQLIQEERINASTDLSRKVVHEVNNPLGIIRNYLKILGLKLPEKHPAQTELSIIGEEIDRIGQIIRQLNEVSQSRPAAREPIDVNALLANMLRLLKDPLLTPAMIGTRFVPDKSAPRIISEKDGLKQIFINLIKNAVEAMPGGGEISISTRYLPDAPSEGAAAKDKQNGILDIVISDNGPGIPEAVQQRLFEPFVSTKHQGRGIGLSIVHGIVRELDGTITCNSRHGIGTTFTISLPVNGKTN